MSNNKGGRNFDASTFEHRNQSGSTDNSRANLRINADEANREADRSMQEQSRDIVD